MGFRLVLVCQKEPPPLYKTPSRISFQNKLKFKSFNKWIPLLKRVLMRLSPSISFLGRDGGLQTRVSLRLQPNAKEKPYS